MNIPGAANGIVFLLVGIPVVVAQAGAGDATSAMTSSLVQLGAIGVILAWITLVDIPARNKAGADRETVWRQQLEAERASSVTREASFQGALEKHAKAISEVAQAKVELARALGELADELREDRGSRRQ